ncbi:hypothetical protein LJB42_003100 [Komagataella kurtzmanii]|nr:hypothetical protein LJB42_003100 [Komagataella kurtzmanii]
MSYRGRGRGGYGRNQFNGGNNYSSHQFFAAQPSFTVEIRNWNNASKDDLVSFIARKTRIKLQNVIVDHTGTIQATVNTQKDATDLVNWNDVKFAGQSLKITANTSTNGNGNAGSPDTARTIQLLKQFLLSRYNAEIRFLDLTNMVNDPTLVSQGLFSSASTSSKMFPALMKLAFQENLQVDTISMANNNINDSNTYLSILGSTFPRVKNLSLQDNNIQKVRFFENCRHKFTRLRELVIMNNPLTTQSMDRNYRSEVIRHFPRLIMLDGEYVRDESKVSTIFKFPAPTVSMFFENETTQGVATNFLTNYLKLWDSARDQLLQLYAPESQFSFQIDTAHPSPDPTGNSTVPSGNSWSYYLSNSRNLTRISNEKSRMSRLAVGQDQILRLFNCLPMTSHKLLEKIDQFAIETWSFPQLNGIIVSLHGEFEETAAPVQPVQSGVRSHYKGQRSSLSKRSFDRTFVIVFGPNGAMIVASDLLLIRPHIPTNAWVVTKRNQEAAVGTTPSAAGSTEISRTSTPLTHPAVHPEVPNTQPQPTSQLLNTNLTPQQQELAHKVLMETKLNPEFTLMLCEQSHWNYEAAIQTFRSSHQQGQIPPHAFT